MNSEIENGDIFEIDPMAKRLHAVKAMFELLLIHEQRKTTRAEILDDLRNITLMFVNKYVIPLNIQVTDKENGDNDSAI